MASNNVSNLTFFLSQNIILHIVKQNMEANTFYQQQGYYHRI
jgi:hypothetical protein